MALKRWMLYLGLAVTVLLLILIIAIQFWISYRLHPFADTLLKDGIRKSTNGLYSIQYDRLNFNVTGRTMVLRNIDLVADTILFKKRIGTLEHIPSELFNIHIDELEITGIGAYDAIVNKKLQVKNIIISNPEINVTLYKDIHRIDSIEIKPVDLDLYKLFSEKFSSLNIKKIAVKNASVNLYKNSIDTIPTLSSNGIHIDIKQLKIDSTYSVNRFEINLAKKVKIKIAEARWTLPDSIYRLQIINMNLDAIAESLSFEKVQFIPLIGKYDIAKIKKHEDDWIRFSIQPLQIEQLDMNKLIYNGAVFCKKVLVKNLNLNDFRYKSGNIRTAKKLLPVDQLRNAPIIINIDSLLIQNGRIEYAEQVPERNFPGTVFFNKVNAKISNITNYYNRLRLDSICKIVIDGNLMGVSRMNINCIFNQTSLADSFKLIGSLAKIEMKFFNQFIFQTANAQLENGIIDQANFSFSGNDISATGSMTMLYHDLSLKLISENDNGDLKKHRIGNVLMNAFVFVNENPKDGETRTVKLYAERTGSKYIFNYFWQTLLSGIKSTVISNSVKKGQQQFKKAVPKIAEHYLKKSYFFRYGMCTFF